MTQLQVVFQVYMCVCVKTPLVNGKPYSVKYRQSLCLCQHHINYECLDLLKLLIC